MPPYQIVDWDEHFENNRTRSLRDMRWVPMPNRMDGDGYTELVEAGDDEAAIRFGCWCAIVEIASRCEPRGTLLRSGEKPHTCHSLSRISHIPAACFERVIDGDAAPDDGSEVFEDRGLIENLEEKAWPSGRAYRRVFIGSHWYSVTNPDLFAAADARGDVQFTWHKDKGKWPTILTITPLGGQRPPANDSEDPDVPF